jgi:hypothetical protein
LLGLILVPAIILACILWNWTILKSYYLQVRFYSRRISNSVDKSVFETKYNTADKNQYVSVWDVNSGGAPIVRHGPYKGISTSLACGENWKYSSDVKGKSDNMWLPGFWCGSNRGIQFLSCFM